MYNIDAKVIIGVATLLVLMIIFIQIVIKFFEVRKELYEAKTKIVYETKFIKVSYDNDMKVFLEYINEYVDNISFTSLKEYHNSKNIINDKLFDELNKTMTLEISAAISQEYLDLISTYLADPQMFIYEKVYYRLLTIVMDINQKNIASL